MKTLILGGARSGKSSYAEKLARKSKKEIVYIATGWAGDEEMALRIAHHQKARPSAWQTVDGKTDLAEQLSAQDGKNRLLLIDCLTLWISNCLSEKQFNAEQDAFLELLPRLEADIILVSNEVGSGVVPMGELSREFVDASGRLHQRLANLCDCVTLVVAGLGLSLKG